MHQAVQPLFLKGADCASDSRSHRACSSRSVAVHRAAGGLCGEQLGVCITQAVVFESAEDPMSGGMLPHSGSDVRSDAVLSSGIAQADAFAASSPRPVLLLLVGLPGSGKTSFGQMLKSQSAEDWKILNLGAYGTGISIQKGAAMASRALEGGHSVIVDACNLNAAQRGLFAASARRVGAEPRMVVLDLAPQLCRQRVLERTSHEGGAQGRAHAPMVDRLAAQQQKANWLVAGRRIGRLTHAEAKKLRKYTWPPLVTEDYDTLQHCCSEEEVVAALDYWIDFSRGHGIAALGQLSAFGAVGGPQSPAAAPGNTSSNPPAAAPAVAASPTPGASLLRKAAGGVLKAAAAAPQRVQGSKPPGVQRRLQIPAAVQPGHAAVPTAPAATPVQTPGLTVGAAAVRKPSRFAAEAGVLFPGTPSPVAVRPASVGSGGALGQTRPAAAARLGPRRQCDSDGGGVVVSSSSSSGRSGGDVGGGGDSIAGSATATQRQTSRLLAPPHRHSGQHWSYSTCRLYGNVADSPTGMGLPGLLSEQSTVAMRAPFPISEGHIVVISKKPDLGSVADLRTDHLDHLRAMQVHGQAAVATFLPGHEKDIDMGFSPRPFMQRFALDIVIAGKGTSNKKTPFLIPLDVVVDLLEKCKGAGIDVSSGVPLKCTACGSIVSGVAGMQQHAAGCSPQA